MMDPIADQQAGSPTQKTRLATAYASSRKRVPAGERRAAFETKMSDAIFSQASASRIAHDEEAVQPSISTSIVSHGIASLNWCRHRYYGVLGLCRNSVDRPNEADCATSFL